MTSEFEMEFKDIVEIPPDMSNYYTKSEVDEITEPLREGLTETSQEVTGLEQDITKLNQDVTDLEGDIDGATDSIQSLNMTVDKLREDVGTIKPYKHPQYGEIYQSLQEQIGTLDYLSTREGGTAPVSDYSTLVGAINAVYTKITDAKTELDNDITTLDGKIDELDTETTADIKALEDNIVDFKLVKLTPNDTFVIKPNMICVVVAGSNNIINYYKADNTLNIENMGSGVIFATETNHDIEEWASSTTDLSKYYRVFTMYKTSGAWLTMPIASTNDFLDRGAYIKNMSSDVNVYIYCIQRRGDDK